MIGVAPHNLSPVGYIPQNESRIMITENKSDYEAANCFSLLICKPGFHKVTESSVTVCDRRLSILPSSTYDLI